MLHPTEKGIVTNSGDLNSSWQIYHYLALYNFIHLRKTFLTFYNKNQSHCILLSFTTLCLIEKMSKTFLMKTKFVANVTLFATIIFAATSSFAATKCVLFVDHLCFLQRIHKTLSSDRSSSQIDNFLRPYARCERSLRLFSTKNRSPKKSTDICDVFVPKGTSTCFATNSKVRPDGPSFVIFYVLHEISCSFFFFCFLGSKMFVVEGVFNFWILHNQLSSTFTKSRLDLKYC